MPAGRPPIYDPEFHPGNIIKLMGDEGFTAVEVAKEWGITTRTIMQWVKDHKEFSHAYTRAREYCAAWYLRQGRRGLYTQDGVRFDSRLLAMMLKCSGVNMDEREVKLLGFGKAKTFSEKAGVICKAMANGKVTPKEAQNMVDVIAVSAKIEEVTELRARLEEIEEHLNVR